MAEVENRLGAYLRDRRSRLDPVALGLPMARRRTPGLRREEVAQRANVSATWYTWLEQGRGGAASADVLDRIARALMLTDVEREHVFLLGLGRPPEVRYQTPEAAPPRLQRVLDALRFSPAYIKTSTWDVVAWNEAAAVVLHNYGRFRPEQRNILRMMFSEPHIRSAQTDWEGVARFAVAAFRADAARAGATQNVAALVEELSRLSPDFARIWAENDVRSTYGEFAKTMRHPRAGLITFEYSAFAVDGRPDLDLVIYNPATEADERLVLDLLAQAETEAAPERAAAVPPWVRSA